MYVLSTSNQRVSVQLLDIKELDLTGNLLLEWKDVGTICEQLPALRTINLSNNLMSPYKSELPLLKNIKVVVLNNTGVDWEQVELLRQSLTTIEELHIMANNISRTLYLKMFILGHLKNWPTLSPILVHHATRFPRVMLLNLEDNCIDEWKEIMKLSQLRCLEKLYLNRNCLSSLFYPDNANNNIGDLASVDSLNLFPNLVDIRLSDNPITDSGRGGVPRFVLIARLAKVQILNGSMLGLWSQSCMLVLKKSNSIPAITLNCVGASMGEKPSLTKKLPATTTVGKLKFLCESFFMLKSMKLKLYLPEEGSPFPMLLDNDTSSLMDLGIGNDSIILVDEESS
ncbi:Tubulin-folding cofactor E [Glycine max]|nr:Tubulin-folding cofactor E [Glycine max]